MDIPQPKLLPSLSVLPAPCFRGGLIDFPSFLHPFFFLPSTSPPSSFFFFSITTSHVSIRSYKQLTMQFTISALVSLAAVVSAASADISGSCDNNNYSASQVNKAASAACDLVKAGRSVGNNNYPHKYNNYEKIDFQAPGPWYEFPIKNNGIFDGSKWSIAAAIASNRIITHHLFRLWPGRRPCHH